MLERRRSSVKVIRLGREVEALSTQGTIGTVAKEISFVMAAGSAMFQSKGRSFSKWEDSCRIVG